MSSTVGLAGPTREIRLPRNRAVVMLIIDVSPSMESTDVSPTRLEAAKEAGKQFADELTPGINLGSIAFGGSARLPAAGADRIALGRQGKPAHQSRCPKGAFTAARRAKEQGVPISTTSFGTPCGYVDFDDQHLPVPVADDTLKTVADLSGGKIYHAADIDQLKDVYATLQSQFGYETTRGDASGGWFRLGVIAVTMAALAGLAINRRLPPRPP